MGPSLISYLPNSKAPQCWSWAWQGMLQSTCTHSIHQSGISEGQISLQGESGKGLPTGEEQLVQV